ncbi:hypothetical protein VTI74DRAFT_7006 [Chaetomium olivicolor]
MDLRRGHCSYTSSQSLFYPGGCREVAAGQENKCEVEKLPALKLEINGTRTWLLNPRSALDALNLNRRVAARPSSTRRCRVTGSPKRNGTQEDKGNRPGEWGTGVGRGRRRVTGEAAKCWCDRGLVLDAASCPVPQKRGSSSARNSHCPPIRGF